MWFLAIPAVLLAVASLAAFLGPWAWWLDVLANFRVQFAAVLVPAGLILLAVRWWRTAAVVLAAAAVNVALILPLYVPPPATPPDGPALRVLSFNVLADNEQYDEVVDYIRSVEADVVVLHEVSRPWEEQILESGLPYIVNPVRTGDLIFGTLVLTPPGAEVSGYGFTVGEPRAVEIRMKLDGRDIAILASHPLSPSTETRSLLRDAQIRFAAEWAADQEVPALVVGDLNATRWSHAFGRLTSIGGLRNSENGFGFQPSFPAGAGVVLRVPIDHLLHSEGWVVAERRLGPALGSDHFPLVVDLVLPA